MNYQSGNTSTLTRSNLPADLRFALAGNLQLNGQTSGAALFADISGFTILTESLKRSLGERRGAEQLAFYLNQVYDSLIAEVDRLGGSVIGFSGDAITCWFDDDFIYRVYDVTRLPLPADREPAGRRALTCALAMLEAMQKFNAIEAPGQGVFSLRVKIAVASGMVTRMTVGDPSIQRIEVAAGETLLRMAAAEHLAVRGEVLADEATLLPLGEQVEVAEWRSDPDTDERFGVVQRLHLASYDTSWPMLALERLTNEQVRPWLLPDVYERLIQGMGEFLTELRPATALFLRFSGIDFEQSSAASQQLDQFIRWVQSITVRYEGTLIQLTVGEKGSYLYIAFGAPRAHEDDPERALRAALELRLPPPELNFIKGIQIGLSKGTMRTGAYGGVTRRTYGVLGDDVNLAARLMQMARPDGQILVSGWLQEAARRIFVWEELAAVQVKGKNEPVPIAALLDVAESQVSSLAVQAHPLVGRQAILDQLVSAAARLFETPPGFAGAVIMDGEAGVGKTRLAQELRFRLENQAQPMVWVECPADPILGLSLYPFKHWLRARFDQDNQLSAAENQARFDEGLNNLIAGLTERGALDLAHECDRTRSMLAAMLGLRQSNSLYDQLEPRLRFENMLQALRSFILAESLCRPMVLHFEDAHHLDPDSQAVLRLLARGVEGYPLLLLLTGRYCDQANQECFSFQSEELPSRLEVQIKELSTAEICRLARYILNPAGAPELEAAIGPELAQYLSEKTNGNPLFVEEILLELSERKLLEQQDGLWRLKPQAQAEVPAGLTGLLITRLDRLDNVVKMGVQTAAVLGREFDAAVLDDMLPGDGISHLLESGQVTQIWSASGAHRFSFRQSMLRDAAYTMQPQSRLQSLHHQAASSIQQVYVQDLPRHYADLAYHYSQAQDDRQALHFARLAGTAAAAEYANRQAIQLFLLALERAQRLPDAETIEDRQAIHAALGELLLITGQRLDAGEHLQAGLSLAEERGDRHAQARFYRFLARLSENQADYPQALHWIEAGLQALGDDETDETSELLNNAGLILSRQGELAAAQAKAERCLLIANRLERPATRARACNLLGHIARLRGDNRQAVENFSQALALYRQANDLNGQAISFNQMATALFNLSEWREANGYFSQAREMFEKIGDPYHRAFTDNNLGWIALNQGRLDEALVYLQGGLATLEQVGASPYVKGAFHSNLGLVYMRRGELQQAAAEFDASQALFEQAGARDFLPELNRNRADLALLAGDLPHAEAFARTALELAQTLNIRLEAGHSLRVLGEIAAIEGHFEQALEHYQNSYQIFLEMGEAFGQARTLIARARLPIPLSDQEKAALQATLPVLQGLGAERELAQARSALG